MNEFVKQLELGLTPLQKIRFFQDGVAITQAEDLIPSCRSVYIAFERKLSNGFWELYRQSRLPENSNVSFFKNAEVGYWNSLIETFLRELCQAQEESFYWPVERFFHALLPAERIRQLVDSAPLMTGLDYLTPDFLTKLGIDWSEMVLGYVRNSQNGLDQFLRAKAPGWHDVGSVWFHLAENKKNPDWPFCFLATFTTDISAGGKIQHKPLGQALIDYAGAKNKKMLQKILAPILKAEENSELLQRMVSEKEIYSPCFWTARQAYQFLQESTKFEAFGIKIHIPDWWKKHYRPKIQITIGEKKSYLGQDSLLDFQVSLALGDQTLSPSEISTILKMEGGLVSLRGEWVEADGTKLREALSHWKSIQSEYDDGIGFLEGMRLLAGAPRDFHSPDQAFDQEWTTVKRGGFLNSVLTESRSISMENEQKELKSFQARLRPYQQIGLHWLRFGTSIGLGLCLADDMGLGKTVQLIALLLLIRNQREKSKKANAGQNKTSPGKEDVPPSLLVLPASLLANWQSELTRFAPTLAVRYAHPSMPEDSSPAMCSDQNSYADCDLVVTTYGMLLRRPELVQKAWNLVVLDEAQAIKNSGTRQTRLVKKLKGKARIAMTGTPVENRLSDLWSIFDFLNPGYLGNEKEFLKWCKSLSEENGSGYQPLRQMVTPLVLRRLKTDRSIIADLPDKTEMTVYTQLAKEQAALYTALVEELKKQLLFADGIKRKGLVLSYLMKFKQICNHPSHYRGIPDFTPAKSGKFLRLSELCQEIASRQEKALIFTQFREMTEPLNDFLTTVFHRRGLVLHGGTAIGKRKKLVDEFQSDDGPSYFILSLKAGGTGLNLTAASHVIHFDRWWNPAVEDQATDRAFRIGQIKNVLVHKFVCRGTIEERIDKMIADKKSIAGEILTQGAENLLTEMSNDELLRFVAFDPHHLDQD